jgi:transposase
VVDTNGLPIRLALSAGEAHDNRLAGKLLSRLKSGTMLLADRGYDADWIRALAAAPTAGPLNKKRENNPMQSRIPRLAALVLLSVRARDPGRRGFSVPSLTSLEYWVIRLRG